MVLARNRCCGRETDKCFRKQLSPAIRALFTICRTNYGNLPSELISSFSVLSFFPPIPASLSLLFYDIDLESLGKIEEKINLCCASQASRFHQRWRQLLQIIFYALHGPRWLEYGCEYRYFCCFCCCLCCFVCWPKFCLFAEAAKGPRGQKHQGAAAAAATAAGCRFSYDFHLFWHHVAAVAFFLQQNFSWHNRRAKKKGHQTVVWRKDRRVLWNV